MMKTVVIGTTALFLTASSIANAQSAQSSQTSPPATPASAEDQKTLTDLRIDLVKAALQLTPAQEKLWPPVESAIRARAEDRKARVAKIQETVGRRADESRAEVLRNRDPIAFSKAVLPMPEAASCSRQPLASSEVVVGIAEIERVPLSQAV